MKKVFGLNEAWKKMKINRRWKRKRLQVCTLFVWTDKRFQAQWIQAIFCCYNYSYHKRDVFYSDGLNFKRTTSQFGRQAPPPGNTRIYYCCHWCCCWYVSYLHFPLCCLYNALSLESNTHTHHPKASRKVTRHTHTSCKEGHTHIQRAGPFFRLRLIASRLRGERI